MERARTSLQRFQYTLHQAEVIGLYRLSEADLANGVGSTRFRYLVGILIEGVYCLGYVRIDFDDSRLAADPVLNTPGHHPYDSDERERWRAKIMGIRRLSDVDKDEAAFQLQVRVDGPGKALGGNIWIPRFLPTLEGTSRPSPTINRHKVRYSEQDGSGMDVDEEPHDSISRPESLSDDNATARSGRSRSFKANIRALRHYSDHELTCRGHKFRYSLDVYVGDVPCSAYMHPTDDKAIQTLTDHPDFAAPGRHQLTKDRHPPCEALIQQLDRVSRSDNTKLVYDISVRYDGMILEGSVLVPRALAAVHLQDDSNRKRKRSNDANDRTTELHRRPQKIAKRKENSTCSVCGDVKGSSAFPASLGDEHTHDGEVCIDCWRGWLTAQLDERAASNIKCAHLECKVILDDSDIFSVARPDILELYREKAFKELLKQDPDWQECPNASCTFGYILEQGDGSFFTCQVCNADYCTTCAVEWHIGETCNEHNARVRAQEAARADQASTEWIEQKARQCPQCKAWIRRNGGCDHMTCHCSYEFCYICSAPWAYDHPCNRRTLRRAMPDEASETGSSDEESDEESDECD